MRFARASRENLHALMPWFENAEQVKTWAGPGFRYPYNRNSFVEDCKLDILDSFVLLDANNAVRAFGQVYECLGRCHLGRLAVAPQARGARVIDTLMTQLIDYAKPKFDCDSSSLFVLTDNGPAINAYRRFGFFEATYPETIPIENCLYMIKTD